jgi:CRP-like cAMP-binding protein
VDSSRIAAAPAFTDLPTAELDALAGAMSECEVEAGTGIITLDDYTTSVYVVEQGAADVLSDGGEVVQALGPGDTFGEISLLLTGQRIATVVARTPMRLLSLADQDFQRIRSLVPEFERVLRRLGFERAAR